MMISLGCHLSLASLVADLMPGLREWIATGHLITTREHLWELASGVLKTSSSALGRTVVFLHGSSVAGAPLRRKHVALQVLGQLDHDYGHRFRLWCVWASRLDCP